MKQSWRLIGLALIILLVLTTVFFASLISPEQPSDGTGPAVSGDSKLYINELMSANLSFLADEDGACSDWIELYNSGKKPLSLDGYHLSNKVDKPFLWAFPDVIIKPGEYLLIFASGLDRKPAAGGVLHTSFNIGQKGEFLILSDDRGAIIDRVEPVSLYQDISCGRDPADKSSWLFYTQPTPGEKNRSDGCKQLPLNEAADHAGSIVINEVLAANYKTLKDEDGDFPDWIELYNASSAAVDLSGFFLSNESSEPFLWRMPELALQPNSYLLVYASGKDKRTSSLHTNFSISMDQDVLVLRDHSGRVIDSLALERQLVNVSAGRAVDDPDSWLYYPHSTPGFENEADGYPSLQLAQATADLVITEVMNMNGRTLQDQDGEYPSWVEIFNAGSISVDLANFGLADEADHVRHWHFPDLQIQPGEHLLVFTSGKDRKSPGSGPLHTDFSIRSSGESVYLYDPFNRIVDRVQIGRLEEDISYGRAADTGGWLCFQDATPGKANGSTGFLGYTDSPFISQNGGFFTNTVSLALSGAHPDDVIRFTLDGGQPTEQSSQYTAPLHISRTTVVRAAAFRPGFKPGKAVTQTYFLNVSHVLPVVSLAMNPRDFDDPVYGLYSKGPNASSVFPYFGANYFKDLEVPAAFEFFEPGGLPGFQMNVGLKMFGGWTRAYDQKSMAVFARNRYESNEMNYPFLANKELLQFKHLVLRAGGQDVFRTKIRDILATRLMEDTGMAYQDYREIVLYINGRYWGVYSLREKVNQYFFHYNYGTAILGGVDVLEGNSTIKEGGSENYKAMLAYIAEHDLQRQEHYEYIKTAMDVQSYMDYMILMMYSANIDSGNVRFWRERTEGSKWRWMLYDVDLGFGSGATVTHDSVWFMINPAGTGAGNNFSTFLVRNLLRNNEFRRQFIERFAYHLHNTFNPERVITIIDELAAEIEPEIPMNTTRWERPASLRDWQREVDVLRNFASRRPVIIWNYLNQHLNLSAEEDALFQ